MHASRDERNRCCLRWSTCDATPLPEPTGRTCPAHFMEQAVCQRVDRAPDRQQEPPEASQAASEDGPVALR